MADIVPTGMVAGSEASDRAEAYIGGGEEPENTEEADIDQGKLGQKTFWEKQIKAALVAERRWRNEGLHAEIMCFGEDEDTGLNSGTDGTALNKITDKNALLHANIEVLKPLVFSEVPTPIIRRRFRGDGRSDETDLMAVLALQNLAEFLLDTEPFEVAMKAARDDWLIPGRGAARVRIDATPRPEAESGVEVRATLKSVQWRRLTMCPGQVWEDLPWLAFEVPMTRTQIAGRFGNEVAQRMNYQAKGLIDAAYGHRDTDEDRDGPTQEDSETGTPTDNPFDTALVWEIWSKAEKKVFWISNGYPEMLEEADDFLNLEHFYPMPRPLTATTRGQTLNPRPDIRYYEHRADEIDVATAKLKEILNVISVSGLFPGAMTDEVKKLLDGKSTMIPVNEWIKLMEKGGTQNIIQWLPLQQMVAAINALLTLRAVSQNAMFEESGVSDLMRAQGDPNETATAQQIKGRYAGMRLSDRQRAMGLFARDSLHLMLELAVENYPLQQLMDICALDIPATEMERQVIQMQNQQAMMQFEATMAAYEVLAQDEAMAQQLGPAPQPPELQPVPPTSWELVHDRIKSDFKRKIMLQIETDSTILADEQADKEARVEFLAAIANFIQMLQPLLATGLFDIKTVKELLLFGVRGFTKARSLESMISNLPDEIQGEQPPDIAVQVAEIKAATDKLIEEMRMVNEEKDRQHDARLKGVEMVAEATRTAAEPIEQPQP